MLYALHQASVVLAKAYATHAGCLDRIIFAGGFLQAHSTAQHF